MIRLVLIVIFLLRMFVCLVFGCLCKGLVRLCSIGLCLWVRWRLRLLFRDVIFIRGDLLVVIWMVLSGRFGCRGLFSLWILFTVLLIVRLVVRFSGHGRCFVRFRIF